ncbi:MAG TPA: hypothetical protein VF169_05000 [Albitalea sp.]|uniref:hypothetical protein n=1 Tax=Piscinibacter sp. TaxID=1903157 RepID=UPI002ED2A1A6
MPVVGVDFEAKDRDPPAPSGEGWPTTQRFSRRAGECMRGCDYAAAVERPAGEPRRAGWIAAMFIACSVLAAALALWPSA